MATKDHPAASIDEQLELFTQELQRLKSTYAYRNMMRFNPDLEDRSSNDIALAFHALTCVSSAVFASPIVAGSFVRALVDLPKHAAEIVAQARATWGAADIYDIVR